MSKRVMLQSTFVLFLLFCPVEGLIVNNVFAGVSQAKMQQLLKRIPRISATVAYSKFQSGTIILIDTMSPKGFKRKHILGAINIPYDGPIYLERIKRMRLPFPKSKEIILY